MKNILTKISALVLVAIMVVGMSTVAFATATLTSGEVGAFYPGHVDEPNVDDKVITIEKQIKAYNPDEDYVYGPAIVYNYAISAASGAELVDITDQDEDHNSGAAITKTALGGITTNVEINSAGASDDKVEWTNTDILNASSAGTLNTKTFTVDFTNVIFTGAGVYRYKITESVTSYTGTGVDEVSNHIRYLDVYVMPSSTYTDGSTAAQWRVYGYVCIDETSPADVTPSTTTKTNGFVNAQADDYYTYNLTLSKNLINDVTMIGHKFPFSVAFSNTLTGTFQLIVESDGTHSTVTSTANVAAGAATVNGGTTAAAITKLGSAQVLSASPYTMTIADGNLSNTATTGFVKIIGIPYTEVASVTETNDLSGVAYTTSVKENGSAVDVTSVSGATAQLVSGTPNTASISENDTATRTAAISNANFTIEFTNALAVISPTGVIIRVAPYAAVLGFGIFFLILFARRRKDEEEDEVLPERR